MGDETRKKEQTARGQRGEAFVRVKFAPDPAQAAARAARPEGLNQIFGQPVARALAPIASLLADGPKTVASLGTQEGRVKVRSGIDTLMGRPYGGEKVPVQPVEEALAQGREAGPVTEIAPADKQSQMIAAILGSGLTVNEAATVSGMLPQTAGRSAPSAKDTVMSQAAQLSEQLFQSQVNQAAELAKTDPVGARAIVEKATADHFNRQSGLVGFNPVQLAQAQRMGGGEE